MALIEYTYGSNSSIRTTVVIRYGGCAADACVMSCVDPLHDSTAIAASERPAANRRLGVRGTRTGHGWATRTREMSAGLREGGGGGRGKGGGVQATQ
jgi:hypothetical protein